MFSHKLKSLTCVFRLGRLARKHSSPARPGTKPRRCLGDQNGPGGPATPSLALTFGQRLFFVFQSRKHANKVRLYDMLHPADGGCPAKKLRTDNVSPPASSPGSWSNDAPAPDRK